MDQLVQTLREQHEKEQAGDGTFHWSFLTKPWDSEYFTRGSLGRFVHPTYGLIRARFCKFRYPAAVWTGSPVGFIQGSFDWEVSNDIAHSISGLCAGLPGSYVGVAEGQFAWVIQDGVNIQSLAITGTTPVFGDSVGWVASGTAGIAGVGKLGTVMNPGAISGGILPPASIRVKL